MLPIYLRNVWYSGHLPLNRNRPYDRYGNPYNITQVVDGRANFVQEKYEAYSVSALVYQINISHYTPLQGTPFNLYLTSHPTLLPSSMLSCSTTATC